MTAAHHFFQAHCTKCLFTWDSCFIQPSISGVSDATLKLPAQLSLLVVAIGARVHEAAANLPVVGAAYVPCFLPSFLQSQICYSYIRPSSIVYSWLQGVQQPSYVLAIANHSASVDPRWNQDSLGCDGRPPGPPHSP